MSSINVLLLNESGYKYIYLIQESDGKEMGPKSIVLWSIYFCLWNGSNQYVVCLWFLFCFVFCINKWRDKQMFLEWEKVLITLLMLVRHLDSCEHRDVFVTFSETWHCHGAILIFVSTEICLWHLVKHDIVMGPFWYLWAKSYESHLVTNYIVTENLVKLNGRFYLGP